MKTLNVNPCRWTHNEYTFEPGNIPHIINVRMTTIVGNGAGIVPINALVYADHQQHALDILRGMLEMRCTEGDQQIAHLKTQMASVGNPSYYDPDMTTVIGRIGHARAILAALHNPIENPLIIITVEQLNRNHMHRISWAANDTFLQ